MHVRWRERAAVVVSALLAVVLLGPALGPGYALVVDQVFVPDQDLLPWMAGIGGGLPRAVPQDVVVALLTGPVPGWVWQTVALLAALCLLGTGVARLAAPAGRRAATVAAVVAVWSPYVGERLLIGHWSLLLAVGALPWALVHARDARDGVGGAWARWLLVLALASLTVTGGILALLVTVPVLLWRGGQDLRTRAAASVAGLVLQLPWLVPALVHPGSPAASGAGAFALRSEGALGVLGTALSTGGIWTTSAVPGSRTTWLAPLLTVTVLLLAAAGARRVVPTLGRPVALTLVSVSALGLVVAVVGAWSEPGMAWIVEHLPGGGLLRDGQKWLAPWLLLLSLAAGCGAARVAAAAARRSRDAVVGASVLVALAVVPVACLPDLAWGSLGRLAGVDYPDDWTRVRQVLSSDPAPGDVVALPWSAYRSFEWNLGRTVIDPAPRFMPRTVVVSGDLPVLRDGELVVVPGDDPRANRIGAALATGEDLGPVLRREGIGFALVEHVEGAVPTLPDAVSLVRGRDLDLLRLPLPEPVPAADGVVAVVLGNLLALAVVVGGAAHLVRTRLGHSRT